MLFQNASAEIALLFFTLLVPTGIMALAAMALVRGLNPDASTEAARKAGKLTTLPAVVMLIGLACSFLHLGHVGSVFFMLSGTGHSPLSNEILVAAIAIAIGVIYWILCLVKTLPASTHKVFGIVLLIVALICAFFTGTAYSIDTIPTWNTAFNWIGQISLSLLGGSALAAASLAIAGFQLGNAGKILLTALGGIGLIGVAVTLVCQASLAAAAVSSVGALTASTMTDYAMVAAASIILCAIGYALLICGKGNTALVCIGAVCVLVGLALMRVDFYGVYLSAGLAIL